MSFSISQKKKSKIRGIEKEFWMHRDEESNWMPNYVIRSPRECKSIMVNSKDLKYRLLMIHKDKEELKGTNVLKYIKKGEKQRYHERPTCASRKRWYELPDIKAPILSKRFVDITFGYFLNPLDLFIGDTFFVISPKDKEDILCIAAYLNSTVGSFLTEVYGRTVMGEGVLLIYGPEIVPMPIVTPKLLPDRKTKIVKNYSSGKINSIFDEIGANFPNEVTLDKVKPDRRELDKIIMGEILGLTEDEQLEVYRAVVDLVRSRIEKARSFGKKGKTKEGIDVELLTRTIKEKLGDKLLGHFYSEKILNQKNLKTVKLFHPIKDIHIKNELFGWRLSSGKDHIDCQGEAEAEYLKIWLESGLEEVKVPKDESYIMKILPELKELKERIDRIISDHISSITSQKLQNKILQKLQGELFG